MSGRSIPSLCSESQISYGRSQIFNLRSEILDAQKLFAADGLGLRLGGDDDGFRLRIVLDRLLAVLLADAALLDAAERQLIVDDLRRVDPGVAGLDVLGGEHRLVDVARPDRRS